MLRNTCQQGSRNATSRSCSSPAETDSGELWEENLIILSPLTIDLFTGHAGAFVWDARPASFLMFGVISDCRLGYPEEA